MRDLIVGLCMLCCAAASTVAQVSIGIGLPGVSIGINLPLYPELVPVPGYPVYYAPRLSSNYFFYDGLYWVYEGDRWYASAWYNGPWRLVDPRDVPVFVLRIPVRYYRAPPPYFRGWRADAPPHWGEHWGTDWERQHSGWDRWNRKSAPAPAPLPIYQRRYPGDRYPRQVEQQQVLQGRNYRYQPRDPVVRQHYREQVPQRTATPPASPPPPRTAPGNAPERHPQAAPRAPQQAPQRAPHAEPPGKAHGQGKGPPEKGPQGKGPDDKGPRQGPERHGGPRQQHGGERGSP